MAEAANPYENNSPDEHLGSSCCAVKVQKDEEQGNEVESKDSAALTASALGRVRLVYSQPQMKSQHLFL